jgi:integrase
MAKAERSREDKRLSDREVKNLRVPGYHHDGAGLYLQVAQRIEKGKPAHGEFSKSWIFRFTSPHPNPKTEKRPWVREMGLGGYPTFSLSEARERARAQRQLLADGVDPIAARAALRAQEALRQAKTLTFAECAEKYIAAHRKGWRNDKHVDQWRNTLDTYAGPVIGKLPVQAVDTGLVMRVLEPIWNDKPETASRVRGRVERVLGWATVNGYRTGDNPARWRGHLDNLLPKKSTVRAVEHHPALPYAKIGEFMQELREQPGAAARALEFAILTAARTGEVRGAKPGEFDLDKGIWIVPASRMKAKKEHRVPLSPRALELVKAQPKGGYLFHSDRAKDKAFSDAAMGAVLKRMKRTDITVHGFRSTFRDWAAECTSYPREMCEMALAHTLSSEVEAAYLRTDLFEKRRRLMRDWANYCSKPQGTAKVTPIRKSA